MRFAIFVLLAPCVCLRVFGWVGVAGWPPVGRMAARSACGVFSWCGYLIVGLVFSRLGFWGGSLFLIAHFPDLCLLVLFFISEFLWLCRVAALKSLPVHPFNALIFPILRHCLQSVCIFLSNYHNSSIPY